MFSQTLNMCTVPPHVIRLVRPGQSFTVYNMQCIKTETISRGFSCERVMSYVTQDHPPYTLDKYSTLNAGVCMHDLNVLYFGP